MASFNAHDIPPHLAGQNQISATPDSGKGMYGLRWWTGIWSSLNTVKE